MTFNTWVTLFDALEKVIVALYLPGPSCAALADITICACPGALICPVLVFSDNQEAWLAFQLAFHCRVPLPLAQRATCDVTAWAKFSVTGPSVTDEGLTQLNVDCDDDAVVVGDSVGITVGDAPGMEVGVVVGVLPGVGVVVFVVVGDGDANGERMVNDRLALRCVNVSVAVMVCCPGVHVGSVVIVTLNVPSLLALMVELLELSNETAADAVDKALCIELGYIAWTVAFVRCWLTTYTGVLPSRSSEMLLPGMKWLPCNESDAPILMLLLPLSVIAGAKMVSPNPAMLAIITMGMMIAVIIRTGPQPCLGAELPELEVDPPGG